MNKLRGKLKSYCYNMIGSWLSVILGDVSLRSLEEEELEAGDKRVIDDYQSYI